MANLTKRSMVILLATNLVVSLTACDGPGRSEIQVREWEKPGEFAPSGDYLESHHFNGVGKEAAIIVSTIHSSPVAESSPTWKVRVIDVDGSPVDNATIEIRASGPSGQAGDLLTITPVSAEGDGYYLAEKLKLNEAGDWLLDVHVTWKDQADYSHADNVDIEISILPASM